MEACGLYDAHIVGGADSVMTYAALGKLEHYFTLRDVSPNHKAHIKDWVEKAYACGLLPKVSDVRGRVCHCWHGSMVNRDYKNRLRILTELNFDQTAPRDNFQTTSVLNVLGLIKHPALFNFSHVDI